GSVLHACQRDRVSGRFLTVLVFVGIFIGLVKSTCVILLALLLLPFHRGYVKTAKLDWRLVLPAIAGCAAAMFWSRAISGIGPVYQPYDEFRAGILQIATHPLHLAKTIVISLFQPLDFTSDAGNAGRNAQLFLGSEFTQLPATVMAPILLACIALVAYGNKANEQFDRLDRIIVLATVVLFFVGTHFAMLASWSAGQLGGYNQGIQTRYFVPELPLLGLLVPYLALSVGNKRAACALTGTLLVFGYMGIVIAQLMPIAGY
ncbi:MAG: DUF2142 domain-containing protein, partial [Eggerthellaceae bacterium]|nr:DUF2142 domain-containing protein [Eggerthellaceae bacterium]